MVKPARESAPLWPGLGLNTQGSAFLLTTNHQVGRLLVTGVLLFQLLLNASVLVLPPSMETWASQALVPNSVYACAFIADSAERMQPLARLCQAQRVTQPVLKRRNVETACFEVGCAASRWSMGTINWCCGICTAQGLCLDMALNTV